MDPVATPRLPVYGPADAQADVTAAPGRRGPSAPRQPTLTTHDRCRRGTRRAPDQQELYLTGIGARLVRSRRWGCEVSGFPTAGATSRPTSRSQEDRHQEALQ